MYNFFYASIHFSFSKQKKNKKCNSVKNGIIKFCKVAPHMVYFRKFVKFKILADINKLISITNIFLQSYSFCLLYKLCISMAYIWNPLYTIWSKISFWWECLPPCRLHILKKKNWIQSPTHWRFISMDMFPLSTFVFNFV